MTADKLRYARHLMADRAQPIASICSELGGNRPSTLYHYLHADDTLKRPGRNLPGDELAANDLNGDVAKGA